MDAGQESTMAVEEVVLSVPGHPQSWTEPQSERHASEGSPADPSGTLEPVVRDYFVSARATDRLAVGNWIRRRRRERFDLALKSLVKTIAMEASRKVPDRAARLDVKTQVYGSVMGLAQAMSRDQLIVIRRARRTLRWGLAFAAIGVTGVMFTLIANGWLPNEWLEPLLSLGHG
jgi:hypothetical protein